MIAWLPLAAMALWALAEAPARPPAALDPDHPQARWMAFSRPGAAHRELERLLGDWETTTAIWLEPGGEPYAVSRGTASHTWLEQGRWLALESSGTLMEIPHHGFGMLGYDNFKKKYVASFVDNVTTSMITMEGSWDEAGAVLRLFGTVDEPLTEEHDRAVEYAFEATGPDSLTLRVFDLPRGAASKVMETSFRRAR